MKKITKLLLYVFLIVSMTACGKKKETISGTYELPVNKDSNIYADIPLSATDGFSSNIAVIGADETNSEGSEKLHSESALLIDATTGEVIFQKNPHKKQYPASTTKILTSLLAIKYGDQNAVNTVGNEVIINEDNVVMCDFRIGDQISFDNAIHGAILRSGNDAAAFLAKFVSKDLDEFAGLMNEEASMLGATKSHFVNPHGLYDDNHYTTAYDMYLIFNEAVKYKKFIDVISCKEYKGTLTRTTKQNQYTINSHYVNSNKYVNGALAAPKGIKVIGGKAGYTQLAKRSYIMLAEANDHKYIFVLMRHESLNDTYDDLNYLLGKVPVSKNYADNE